MQSKALVRAAVVFLILLLVSIAMRWHYRQRLPFDPSAFANAAVQPGRRSSETGNRRLIVLFHGYTGRPMTDVRAAISGIDPGADILEPRYSSSPLSNERPLDIVREYLRAIDRSVTAGQYDDIVFVGYSLGALLARKVVVCAYTGCVADYDGVERPREWRSRIDRIVLLAGMNRGWATHCEKVVAVRDQGGVGYENDCRASRLPWHRWVAAEFGQRFGPTLGLGNLIFSVQKGEPFVANLRLEWLELERRESDLPLTVQLLGDIDEIVSRDDNIDRLVTSNFVFLQLFRTNHSNVVDFSGSDGEDRKQQFARAMTWPAEQLRANNELTSDDHNVQDTDVKHVVLIVHGIRDDGRWAKDLGDQFEHANPGVKSFSRSYGYFSALHFLMPSRMNANVRWFVDQYTELRAKYPAARFSFVGHSNGTYMLAQSLAQYHAVDFSRVIFAGSVVPSAFPWARFQKRLSGIRNYRASNDLVVATLPSFFEHVRGYLQVGGAGHAGFIDEFGRRDESRFFALGGHGAVLADPANYSALVNYVLETGCTENNCAAYELPQHRRTNDQSMVAVLAYKFCVLIWTGVVLAIGGFIYAVSRRVRGHRPHRNAQGYLWRSAVTGFVTVSALLVVLAYV